MQDPKCIHVKSKKDPTKQCEHPITKGQFCSVHHRCKKKTIWQKPLTVLTRTQRVAGKKVFSFLRRVTAIPLLRRHGLAYFNPTLASNDTDIYTLDPVTTIPATYRFSYSDGQRVWMFDSRFLMGLMQYEQQLTNPFTQEEIPATVLTRLQRLSESLQKHSLPLLYVSQTLTSEQRWNQKVLDVFLRIRIHGYGVNVAWFEGMTVETHRQFYCHLYRLWVIELQMTDQDKERIVPGHKRHFLLHPNRIAYECHTLKWWMKYTLALMHTLLTASPEKGNQGCGALYILTAFARTLPEVAQVYPWL